MTLENDLHIFGQLLTTAISSLKISSLAVEAHFVIRLLDLDLSIKVTVMVKIINLRYPWI